MKKPKPQKIVWVLLFSDGSMLVRPTKKAAISWKIDADEFSKRRGSAAVQGPFKYVLGAQ